MFRPFFALTAALAGAAAAPVLPTIPATVFRATAYGATGNGTSDDTAGVQAALTAATQAGGGIVELTAGTYLCGPLSMGSGTDLQVDAGATLKMQPYGTYPLGGSVYTNFLSVTGNNVALTGPGTIDGQGAAWWAAYDANSSIPHRPYLIKFTNCNFVLIQNITLINSPMFHVAFSNANNVTANQVTITASANSPNTDGIDPAGAHVLIENCNISNGDDCIAFKPQSTFCTDCTVTNCTFGTGHGVSVGGQTNDGMNGLTVTNCTFNGTTNGLRLKADPTEGGPVTNLTYSNLTMVNVQYPIVFYSYYDQVGTPGATSGSNQTTVAKAKLWNATPPDSLALPTIPTWTNITLSNIKATAGPGAGYSTVWGLPSAPFQNVTFNNVVLTGYPGIELYNVQNVQCTGATNLGNVLVYNAQVALVPPQSCGVALGASAAFSAQMGNTTANSGAVAPGYQWTFNGQPLSDGARSDGSSVAGSNSEFLLVGGAQAAEAGNYAVSVTDALDTYTTSLVPGGASAVMALPAASLSVGTAPDSGRLMDISARAVAGAGANALVAGFVVGGAGTSNLGTSPSGGTQGAGFSGAVLPLLVRGVGPSLGVYGVTGFEVDPTLQVLAYPSGTLVASNDNWGGNQQVSLLALAEGAFPLSSASSLDAALSLSAQPGQYTALVSPNGNAGIALAEVYDGSNTLASPGGGVVVGGATIAPRLINLSARANAGTGLNALVGGFVVGGADARTVLIRGIGPALTAFGVPGALADPAVQVFNSVGTLVGTNDNWGGNAGVVAAASAVGAFTLPDPTSKDSALLLTLPQGNYTATITGAGSAPGNAMIEIYDVP